MSLQFIHQNGGPYYKAQSSEPVQETSHDQTKVLQLGTKDGSSKSKVTTLRYSGYRHMAMGIFFVAMAAGASFIYNQYTSTPTETSGIQNFITQTPLEICDDNIDNDGDGTLDCNDSDCYTIRYEDLDSDGFGNDKKFKKICETDLSTNLQYYVQNNTDCNDQNANIHPNVLENQCDNDIIDNDCSGSDAPTCWVAYQCLDGSRLGIATPISACNFLSKPPLYDNGTIYSHNSSICIQSDLVPSNTNCQEQIISAAQCTNLPAHAIACSDGPIPSIDTNYKYFVGYGNTCSPIRTCDFTCQSGYGRSSSTHTCATDNDGDLIPNIEDNCLNIANENQWNTDGDTFGDVCDSDDDGDTVSDNNEAIGCNLTPDCDGDGIGDANDNCPTEFGTMTNGCPDLNPSVCIQGQTQSCQVSGKFGICKLGTQICDSNGDRGTCNQSKQPVAEICSDLLDNDCDNLTDIADSDCMNIVQKYSCKNSACEPDNINGVYTSSTCDNMCSASSSCTPGTSQACTTNLPGICSIGKQTCIGGLNQVDSQGGMRGTCEIKVQPGDQKEVCNDSLDNDCDGKVDAGDSDCTTNTPLCGNNKIESPEECDDGNTSNGDGCSSSCKKETTVNLCGNGNVDSGEECDDGNYINNDGCSSSCKKDAHMAGGGSYGGGGSNYCGDGIKRSTEQCDEGNNRDGDGCDMNCYSEIPSKNPPSTSPNRLIVDAIKQMIDKLETSCAYHDKEYNEILQKYKDVRGNDYRDPAVILTTFCITNGYKRKGILGFNVNHYASIYESIKIIAKINAISEGVEFDESHPDLPRVPYRDVKKGWFTDYVNYAYEAGLLTDIIRGKELKGFTPITTNQLEILLLNAGKDTTQYTQFLKDTEITRDDMAEIVVDIFKEKFVYAEYMMGENIKFYELVLKQLQGKTPAQQEVFIKNLAQRMNTWNKREMERKLNIYVDGVLKFFDAILNLK